MAVLLCSFFQKQANKHGTLGMSQGRYPHAPEVTIQKMADTGLLTQIQADEMKKGASLVVQRAIVQPHHVKKPVISPVEMAWNNLFGSAVGEIIAALILGTAGSVSKESNLGYPAILEKFFSNIDSAAGWGAASAGEGVATVWNLVNAVRICRRDGFFTADFMTNMFGAACHFAACVGTAERFLNKAESIYSISKLGNGVASFAFNSLSTLMVAKLIADMMTKAATSQYSSPRSQKLNFIATFIEYTMHLFVTVPLGFKGGNTAITAENQGGFLIASGIVAGTALLVKLGVAINDIMNYWASKGFVDNGGQLEAYIVSTTERMSPELATDMIFRIAANLPDGNDLKETIKEQYNVMKGNGEYTSEFPDVAFPDLTSEQPVHPIPSSSLFFNPKSPVTSYDKLVHPGSVALTVEDSDGEDDETSVSYGSGRRCCGCIPGSSYTTL